ncbi:uncharacterized protein [Aristolochia californica]|uniref:uncharacterized protein n=1 Tax=Aristolochia californica TaxID=171875 RepID=UPI0035E2DC80
MLSVENLPDPSCSYNISGLKGDERATEKFALQEADPEKPGLFSIRNYVFTSRSKDIGTNWPFPPRFLQLCLKHGVKELLPPFEPPDSVRGQSSGTPSESDQLILSTEGEERASTEVDLDGDKDANNFLDSRVDNIEAKSSDPWVLENSDKEHSPFLQEDNQGDGKSGKLSKSSGLSEAGGEEESTITVAAHAQAEFNSICTNRLSCLVPEINKKSDNPVILSEKSRNSSEPQENKRRLIVKLGGVSESSRTEEIISNSCSVVDPMALKLCPVCKTFSSTSNTTLNAHIDQCLSEESTGQRVVTKFNKPHKVKPRKKRSMVDICATAPRCTLEELERRNGLTRATDSSSAAPNGETCHENKRPRWGPTDFCDDENDSAVYVDSSGTKIRILSRFNDTQTPVVVDDRNIPAGKKRLPGFRGSKTFKTKSQSKKFCSMKLYKGEILKATENHQAKNQEKRESLFQLLKARDPEQATGPPGSLRQWVCSKRTGLSKKSSEKGPMPRDPLHESNHSSIQRSHILRLSRRPENSLSYPKSRREETLLGSSIVVDGEEGTSHPSPESDVDVSTKGPSIADRSIPKLARSPGNYVSSPRSKGVEVDANVEDHHFSLNTRRISSLRKSDLLGKSSPPIKANKWNEKKQAFKKSCKDKFMDQRGHQMRPPPADELMGSRPKRLNKMHNTNKLSHLENVKEREVEELFAETSDGDKIVASTPEGSSAFSGPEKLDSEAGGSLSFESDHSASLAEEAMVGEDASPVFPVETACADAPCDSEMSGDDGSANHSVMQSDSTHLLGNVLTVAASGSAISVDHNTQRYYGQKEMHSHDYGTGISSQTAELDHGVDEGSLSEAQNTGCDSDAMPIQGSELCLPSFEDMGYEVLHGNSLFAARNVQSTQDTEKPRDPSPSAVSATSTDSPSCRPRSISPPPVQDKVSGSCSDGTAELVEAVDMIRSSTMLFSSNIGGVERSMNIDRDNLKITIASSNDLKKISDDQPCCCSRKENNSRVHPESQFFRQSTSASGVIPKGKQMILGINNNRPEIASPVASFPSSKINSPTRESPLATNKLHLDTSRKFYNCGDFGLASPSSSQLLSQSTSSPVLRLMGKNLMVVNRDEDEPVQLQKSSLGTMTDHPNAKYLTLLGFSTGSALNQDSSALYHQSADGSVVYGQDTCSLSSNVSTGLSSSFRGHNSSQELPAPPQEMWVGSFAGPALAYGSKANCDSLAQQKRMSRRFSSQSGFAYNVERSALHQVTRSSREVIVIDDSPELEPDPRMSAGPAGSQLGLGAILSPSASNCNSRPAKAFSSYSMQDTFLREPSGPKPSFLMSCPRANATSTMRGNPEGSGVFPQSPFLLSSTGYLNSTVYYTSSPKSTK